jgi:hypothetical protein
VCSVLAVQRQTTAVCLHPVSVAVCGSAAVCAWSMMTTINARPFSQSVFSFEPPALMLAQQSVWAFALVCLLAVVVAAAAARVRPPRRPLASFVCCRAHACCR